VAKAGGTQGGENCTRVVRGIENLYGKEHFVGEKLGGKRLRKEEKKEKMQKKKINPDKKHVVS